MDVHEVGYGGGGGGEPPIKYSEFFGVMPYIVDVNSPNINSF